MRLGVGLFAVSSIVLLLAASLASAGTEATGADYLKELARMKKGSENVILLAALAGAHVGVTAMFGGYLLARYEKQNSYKHEDHRKRDGLGSRAYFPP